MKMDYLKKKIAKIAIFAILFNVWFQFIFWNINYVSANDAPPVVTLIWSWILNLEKWINYTELWAEWSDPVDWTWIVSTISWTVNSNILWIYTLDYIKVNSLWLTWSIIRTVNVIDTTSPAIPSILSTWSITKESSIYITWTWDINEFINLYNSWVIVWTWIINSSWSFNISITLNEWLNTITAKSYDISWNYSANSISINIVKEWTWTIDYCPAWDKSWNLYDLICWKAKWETWTWIVLDKPNLNKNYVFMDLGNSFSKSYVEILQNKWVIKVYSGRLFIPNKKITRAEFLVLAMKAFEINLTSTWTNSFTDITKNWEWLIPYLIKAKELGIINGQNKNWKLSFKPEQPISRIEAIAILFRMANLNTSSTNILDFTDGDFQDWMLPYAKKAKQLRITDGQTENWKLKFKPNSNITRAEASKFIVKFLDTIK